MFVEQQLADYLFGLWNMNRSKSIQVHGSQSKHMEVNPSQPRYVVVDQAKNEKKTSHCRHTPHKLSWCVAHHCSLCGVWRQWRVYLSLCIWSLFPQGFRANYIVILIECTFARCALPDAGGFLVIVTMLLEFQTRAVDLGPGIVGSWSWGQQLFLRSHFVQRKVHDSDSHMSLASFRHAKSFLHMMFLKSDHLDFCEFVILSTYVFHY